MDICIAAGAWNKTGGIERYNVELASALIKKGHRVFAVITSDNGHTNFLSGIFRIKTSFIFPAVNFFVNAIKGLFLYRHFKRSHPGGIFISDGFPALGCDVVIAQSVHKKAVVVTNKWESKNFSGFLHKFLRFVRPLNIVAIGFEWFVFHYGAKSIIAISQKVKREIIEVYKIPEQKISVVYSAVNFEEFAPNKAARNRLRSEHKFFDSDFVFLFSGNEFKRKGLAYAIRALATIGDVSVKLVVVGRAKREAYEALAKNLGVLDMIFFVGHRSDFADWCSASDAFLFPTLDEAFGLVTVEAMAAGLPLIVSGPQRMGSSELLTDGLDAILLKDPTDVDEISQKMRLVISDKNLRAKLGEGARKTAEKMLWEHVADGIIGAWEYGQK